jgi:hypothetical protein
MARIGELGPTTDNTSPENLENRDPEGWSK